MVQSQFEAILKALEQYFGCSLHPDGQHSCLVKLENGLSVQLEMDQGGSLLIGSRVGKLPRGRYRLLLMRQMLKFNAYSLPSLGIFGLSQKSRFLIFFLHLSPARLTEEELHRFLSPFLIKAKQWAEAIAKEEVPPLEKIPLPGQTTKGLI
jgi:hypothetical protein